MFGTEEVIIKNYLDLGEEAVAKVFKARLVNFLLVGIGVIGFAYLSGDKLSLFSLIIASQGLSMASVYEVHGQNRRYAIIFLLERAIYIFWLWVGIWLFDGATLGWIFWSLCLWTAASICCQVVEKWKYLVTPITTPIGQVWCLGVSIVAFSVTKYVYGGGTRIFIKESLGYSDLGIYSVAWQFVPLVTMFLTQVSKNWRARITEAINKKDFIGFKVITRQVIFASLIPVIIISIIFSCVGGWIVNLMFSAEYGRSVILFPLLSVYFVIINLDVLNSIMWVALGEMKMFSGIFAFFSLLCASVMWVGGGHLLLTQYLLAVVVCHGLAVCASAVCLIPKLRRVFFQKIK